MDIHAKQPRVVRFRRRRSANKGLRFLAVVAAASAVIAPATLAFGNAGRHLLGQGAPPSVRDYFSEQNRANAEMERWERTHSFGARQVPVHVNAAQAKGVIEVATGDGPLALWVASAANGHVCWFVGFRADQRSGKPAPGSGTCETAAAPSSKIDWGFGWGAEHPSLKILSGRVYVPATSLLVSDQAGHATRIPVIGSYFLAAFPRSAHIPTKLVALSSNGRVVGTFREAHHRVGSRPVRRGVGAAFKILVLNGTRRPGLAARLSSALRARGFSVVALSARVANAPWPVSLPRVYFDPSQPESRANAQRVSVLFRPKTGVGPITKPVARISRFAGRPAVVVVVGTAFRGLR